MSIEGARLGTYGKVGEFNNHPLYYLNQIGYNNYLFFKMDGETEFGQFNPAHTGHTIVYKLLTLVGDNPAITWLEVCFPYLLRLYQSIFSIEFTACKYEKPDLPG